MKEVYVITEGDSDAEILKAVLPEKVVKNVQFVVGSGRYSAQSLARSILAVEQMPVALVVDADTNETAAVQEQHEFLQASLNQASPDVPFEVFLAVPEIEVLLVQDLAFLKRLTKRSRFSDMEVEFARLHPKKFLLNALEREEPYEVVLRDILGDLDEQTVEAVQQHPLVEQLGEFVLSITEAQLVPQ
jgi:hypothetical protein